MTTANEQTDRPPADGSRPERGSEPKSSRPPSVRPRGTRVSVTPCELAAALNNVVTAAEELVDAISDCPDLRIIGCDFEAEFTRLKTALSRLPRYYEGGSYIWRDIDRDYRHDAPGG